MATINNKPLARARFEGEFYHSTFTTAEMTAYILVDSSNGGWLDRVRTVSIHIALRAGHGPTDHLFDRTAERVANAVEGKLFASVNAIKKAGEAVRGRECEYSFRWDVSTSYIEVPPELKDAAELIRDADAHKSRLKDQRQNAKFIRTLVIREGEDKRYRVTTEDAHKRARWINAIDGLYWYCEGLDSRARADCAYISGPNRGYATREEAENRLSALV